jgi:hypothetical protein
MVTDRQKMVNNKILGEMGLVEGLEEIVNRLEGRLPQEFEFVE